MLATLRRYRLEVKYAVLGVVIVAGIVLLASYDAFHGLDGAVNDVMDQAAALGLVGVFVVAMVVNTAVVVQIPYTLPLLLVALDGASLGHMLALGLACGAGGSIGKLVSYRIADRLLARNPDLPSSRLYRWVETNAEARPLLTRWLVFVTVFTPIPDDTIVIPLAMVRFGLRRLWLPIVSGKVLHNVCFAVLVHYATSWFAQRVTADVRADAMFGLVAAFVLLVMYQVEKGRQRAATASAEPTVGVRVAIPLAAEADPLT